MLDEGRHRLCFGSDLLTVGTPHFQENLSTLHVEAGVSPAMIQRWLGHADLATTMRYLAAADIRSERTRLQVNTTFAGLSIGGAG